MKSPNPFIFVLLLIIVSIFNVVDASPAILVNVSTDEQTYSSGQLVRIYGNLTRDETPITDALVAIQINDAENNILLIRTRSTGTTPSPRFIDITRIVSCDQAGNPKDTFKKGTLAYFKLTAENLNTISERYTIATINLYDSKQVSIGISWVGTTIGPGQEFTYLCSIPIPPGASAGTAYAFANAYNKWPKENGIAYCGEKAVAFTITDDTSSSTSSDSINPESISAEGAYELTFRLQNKPRLGDHTVYASYYQTLATATFDVVWLYTDLNRDGQINIVDISEAATAFQSAPGDPRWNSKADLDHNDIINIVDIARIATDFGKKRT